MILYGGYVDNGTIPEDMYCLDLDKSAWSRITKFKNYIKPFA